MTCTVTNQNWGDVKKSSYFIVKGKGVILLPFKVYIEIVRNERRVVIC